MPSHGHVARLVSSFLALLAVGITDAAASAQCATAWSPGNAGLNGAVTTMIVRSDGSLVVGGDFTTAGGIAANGIAVWNGVAWSAVGSGIASPSSLAALANGDLIVGGYFSLWTGENVARWDGAAWAALGGGLPVRVRALAVLPNGDLVTGQDFGILQRWNGSAWLPFSGAGLNGSVRALRILANGDLVAAGGQLTLGGPTEQHIVRWDGTSWSTFGPVGFPTGYPVDALAQMPNGDVVASVSVSLDALSYSYHVARWNGASWTNLGNMNGVVRSLAPLPNGDLLAAGDFTVAGGVGASRIARWNGAAWAPLGAGLDGSVAALATLPNGEIAAGGSFATAGGSPSPYLARLTTTCPATAVSFASGCPASGGSNTLSATTLPWVDATFRAAGTGLPAPAYVLSVYGLSPVVPSLALDSVFPAALPGCNLDAMPDGIETLFTTTGTVQSQVYLPNTPPLIGVSFYHQLVAVVVDVMGNPVEISSTNTLQLTAGTF